MTGAKANDNNSLNSKHNEVSVSKNDHHQLSKRLSNENLKAEIDKLVKEKFDELKKDELVLRQDGEINSVMKTVNDSIKLEFVN